jgi:carbon monoxide dehydrogenase subunit G
MKFSGTHEIDLNQDVVWKSLRDVDVLSASIPGCESFERLDTDTESYRSVIVTRVGPMKAHFTGKMNIEDANPPHSYRLVGSGSAGSAGAAKGEVLIKLRPLAPDKTILDFDASVALTGRMAQIGGKMIHGTAEVFASEFFDNLARNASAGSDEIQQASEFKVPVQEMLGGKKTLVIVGLLIILAVLGYFWLRS